MSALRVEHAWMSVLLKQSAKVKSTKLMPRFAPIADHVPKYVLLMQYPLSNKV
jgi:hypothetical protein